MPLLKASAPSTIPWSPKNERPDARDPHRTENPIEVTLQEDGSAARLGGFPLPSCNSCIGWEGGGAAERKSLPPHAASYRRLSSLC